MINGKLLLSLIEDMELHPYVPSQTPLTRSEIIPFLLSTEKWRKYLMEKMKLENRINLLRQRDAVANASIIKKLERQLRKISHH